MTRYNNLALVTCAAHPTLYADEQQLVALFASMGVQATPVVWNDPSVPWSRFDRVVLRSVWDYFERFDEFNHWLERMVELRVPLLNSPSLVRWNMDKRYLRELAERGVATPPTRYVEPGERFELAAFLRERGWSRAIIKPAISGGAYRTHRVTPADAPALQHEVEAILQGGALLVQPFLDEILTEGEHSLVFFAGEFSHALIKRPARGDYRVQPQYNGTFEPVTPTPALLAAAEAVLRALPEVPLYARIDGIRRGDEFLLMEAELIEPYLYAEASPGALERYARLITR